MPRILETEKYNSLWYDHGCVVYRFLKGLLLSAGEGALQLIRTEAEVKRRRFVRSDIK